ncbi:MAG: hypothetical protein H7Z12_09880 [Rhodospirillaceae bacterium]|nr:hypothetical protein [Rhodospirillales bacterium]
MKKILLLALPLALAACGDSRLTPAPGEQPGWPQSSPPRPSTAPLPFTTNYAPHSGTTIASPPVNADGNIPYAVRGAPPVAAPDAVAPDKADPHPGTQ